MTEARKIYIKSATQISMQQPLSEEWLTAPLVQTETYVRSQDPNFREWLNPLESRRMGKHHDTRRHHHRNRTGMYREYGTLPGATLQGRRGDAETHQFHAIDP